MELPLHSKPPCYFDCIAGQAVGGRVRDEEKGASALGPRGSGVVGLRPLTPGVYIPTPEGGMGGGVRWWWFAGLAV